MKWTEISSIARVWDSDRDVERLVTHGQVIAVPNPCATRVLRKTLVSERYEKAVPSNSSLLTSRRVSTSVLYHTCSA